MEAKVTTHRCKVCGKDFSSGKAFGGHWRSHLQKARQATAKEDHNHHDHDHHDHHHRPDQALIPQTASNIFAEASREEAAKLRVPCSICDKGFSSMKALGGHMRSHPERDWRGINPPRGVIADNNPASAGSDCADDDSNDNSDDIDLTRALLPSWIGREKRGRGRDAELVEAAEILMRLSKGGPGSSRVSMKQSRLFEEVEAKPSSSSLKLRIVNNSTTKEADYTNCSKGKLVVADNNYGDVNGKKIKIKVEECSSLLDSDDHGNGSVSLLYKCIDCDKSFSTFQGLGGHRSTHNKYLNNKKISGVSIISPNSSLMVEKNVVSASGTNNLTANNASAILVNHHEKKNQFQVKVNIPNGDQMSYNFPRGFDTRSAETRRRDWTGSPSGFAGPSLEAVAQSQGLGFRDRKSGHSSVLDFDLNELPCAKVGDKY